MNRWITKYWKPVIFTTTLLICISFFVNLLSLGGSYSDSIDSQAVERARNYSQEQALTVRESYELLKTSAKWYATELAQCKEQTEFIEDMQTIRVNLYQHDDAFREMFYAKDGVLYDPDGTTVAFYPVLTEIAFSPTTVVSRVFQYGNHLMSVGVSVPVNGGFADHLVFVYDRSAVSLNAIAAASEAKQTQNEMDSIRAADLLLFCKYDGIVMEKYIYTDRFTIGSESVKTGFLKQLLTDNEEYDRVIAATTGTDMSSFRIRTDSGKYVLTVTPFGAENGGGFLLGLYNMETLYGSGYTLMNSVWGTLILLGILLALFLFMFVTDQLQVSRKMRRLTTVDEGLNCLNQIGFESEATELLERNRTSQYAVVIMQINNFGYIGEKFGEQQSKAVLEYFRNTCAKSMNLSETYAYMRDGKFLLLLHFKDRKALVGRLNGIYTQTTGYRIPSDREYKINVSFSICEQERGLAETVHRMIDKALMAESNSMNHRSTVSFDFYGDVIRENYLRRAEIEGRMQSALENNEFHLFYQPKFNLKKGVPDGCEILVRWFDEKIDKYRQPGEFLPIFEENGFINKLDRFVFYKACENIAERIREKQVVYPVSVNISRVTAIQPDFLSYYTRIKEKFHIKDGFITLEFTESFAYENYEYLAKILEELHKAGFLCSLDDFGTGYSSFSVLKTLDMDEIKIDKSFLDESNRPDRDLILLESIIEMIRKLGIKITQEGVETKEEFEMLNQMGCDVVQGYYFAKPMKYVDYREFIRMNFSK